MNTVNDNAVLQFLGYRITKIKYDCSADFEFPKSFSTFKLRFNKSFTQLTANDVQENLGVHVFCSSEENSESLPYSLTIEIAGRFTCTSKWDAQWEINTLAILFPYLRALVSNISSLSGRPPVILPTVNVAGIFEMNN